MAHALMPRRTLRYHYYRRRFYSKGRLGSRTLRNGHKGSGGIPGDHGNEVVAREM